MASLGYLLAASGLDPRSRYAGRIPAPPASAVEAELTALNVNDRTPLILRYARWAGGVFRGDLGRGADGGSVREELVPRLGVSARLLLAGTVLGAVAGVVLAAYAVLYPWLDRLLTGFSLLLLA